MINIAIAHLLTIARQASGRISIYRGPCVPWITPSTDTTRGSAGAAIFAEAIGITEDRLLDLERGRDLPTRDEAIKLARVYGMDAEHLIARIERERAAQQALLLRLVTASAAALRLAERDKARCEAAWTVAWLSR